MGPGRFLSALIYVLVIHILSFTPVVLPDGVKIKTGFLLGYYGLFQSRKRLNVCSIMLDSNINVVPKKGHIDRP